MINCTACSVVLKVCDLFKYILGFSATYTDVCMLQRDILTIVVEPCGLLETSNAVN